MLVDLLIFQIFQKGDIVMPRKQTIKSKRKENSSHKAINMKNIQEKAYFIWAEKGYPENTTLDNWLEAEKQLRS